MSSSNINKVFLVGNLGGDPELKYTAKGQPYVNLSVATNRRYRTKEGEDRDETHWHRATVWGSRAENCAKHLRKGSKVFLEGELLMRSWTDKEGKARKSAEVQVDSIQFLNYGPRPETPEISSPVVVAESLAYTH